MNVAIDLIVAAINAFESYQFLPYKLNISCDDLNVIYEIVRRDYPHFCYLGSIEGSCNSNVVDKVYLNYKSSDVERIN